MVIDTDRQDFFRSISTVLAAINVTRTVLGLHAYLCDEKPATNPSIHCEVFVMASETQNYVRVNLI